MLQKDFQKWHKRKQALQENVSTRYFYEREVWWTALGVNIGDEEDGKGESSARPVLVVRKFNKNLFYGLPLSSTVKRGKYYCEVELSGRKSVALLSQLRVLDAKRLLSKIEKIDLATHEHIVKTLKNIL